MLWNAITALTEEQHGVVTRAQVLSCGATEGWLKWAIQDGRLVRRRQGVYAVRGSSSRYQELMSACLAGGPSAAASHLEAAALLGARQVLTGAPCITTFDGCCARLPGVTSHRSQLPASEALTRHLGIPVVIPPLTVVQVADISHPELVKGVANDLVKMNWTSFRAILQWSERAGTPRRGQLALRELCHRAIDLGGHMDSPAARDLGHYLIAAGAGGFETNYQVRTAEGVVLIDFAWPDPKVGLEYNGARDHGSRLAKRDDARRRALLTNLGWRIFDANSAVAHAEVVRWVLEALAA